MRKPARQIAAAIIEDAERRLVLQLRDDAPSVSYPNYWGLFGGQLEAGEIPLEAIARELREELGRDVDATRLASVGTFYDTPQIVWFVFSYVAGKEIDHAVLTEGQALGRFSRAEIGGGHVGVLHGRPIIPLVGKVLQHFLAQRDPTAR